MSDIWSEYLTIETPVPRVFFICRGLSGCGAIVHIDHWDHHRAHHEFINETATAATDRSDQ